RRFGGSLGLLTLVMLIGPGLSLLTAQYLQLVLGLSPLQAGLWTLPPSIAVIAGFMAAPLLARRIRPGLLIAAGLAVSALGLALLTGTGTQRGLMLLVTGMTLFDLGF